jgi:Brp/Blh family beta-carotene 15,15'-monooxygenase
MIARYPLLYFGLRLVSLLLAVFALLWPGLALHTALWLAPVVILLLGVPHGAVDHFIFKSLVTKVEGPQAMLRFYAVYLGSMILYGLMWWFNPYLSLVAFLLLSAYHFGQSNWNYVALSKMWQIPVYFLQGAFVLGVPILWHFEDAKPIIQAVVPFSNPDVSQHLVVWSVALLTLLNLGVIVLLWWQGILTVVLAKAEAINLIILLALFLSTPLLLGFALYFSAWHALGSVLDQIAFFRLRKPNYQMLDYINQAAPYSVLAIFGLGAMVLVSAQLRMSEALGMLFVFLSLVTLPHMLLIDLLYNKFVPKSENSTVQ